MYIHNLSPIALDLGFFSIKWYSISYIIGIMSGWYLGSYILKKKASDLKIDSRIKEFENLITYLIIAIIVGGRLGYVIFYNLNYYIENLLDIFKIWEGGMSFHGALIGIIFTTYIFAIKNKINVFIFLDVIACVAPIGLFFGRIANFINAELYGKPTNLFLSVIFPNIDNLPRHASQLYEAFLEGIVLFLILNFFILRKNYVVGTCSFLFLIFYGFFRIIAEQFREPDIQIGFLFNFISMGSLLSLIMICVGLLMITKIKNEKL